MLEFLQNVYSVTSNLSTAPSSVCLDIVDLWWHSRQSTKKSTTSSTVHGKSFVFWPVSKAAFRPNVPISTSLAFQGCFKITKY